MRTSPRILGTSLLSLLLVVVGLFMVCSGRVQDVNFEDEFADDEFVSDELLADESEDTTQVDDDLIGRLDLLDAAEEEGEFGEDFASEEESATFGPVTEAESFLTPTLFDSLNREVGDLSTIAASKNRMIDSLRAELQAVNYQKSAQQFAAETRSKNAKPMPGRGGDDAALFNSEFGAAYQDALDDFYVRNYQRAIGKFRELVARGDHPELADNCQYWIGEAYFAMGNYYQAIAEFQKVLPIEKSNKTNDAQLMIGLAFMKAGEAELARTELNTAVNFGGNSDAAQKAMRYLQLLNNA